MSPESGTIYLTAHKSCQQGMRASDGINYSLGLDMHNNNTMENIHIKRLRKK